MSFPVAFTDCNYTGTAVHLREGSYDLTDDIALLSSIRIPPKMGWIVTFFTSPGWQGKSTNVVVDQSCLQTLQIPGGGNWNDRIRSIKVNQYPVGYNECNYNGFLAFTLTNEFSSYSGGFIGMIRSLRVPRSWRVVAYTNADLSGDMREFESDIDCLPGNWNIGSLTVESSANPSRAQALAKAQAIAEAQAKKEKEARDAQAKRDQEARDAIEAARLAEISRLAEIARAAEAARVARERAEAEAARIAEEARVAEEARIAKEKADAAAAAAELIRPKRIEKPNNRFKMVAQPNYMYMLTGGNNLLTTTVYAIGNVDCENVCLGNENCKFSMFTVSTNKCEIYSDDSGVQLSKMNDPNVILSQKFDPNLR